MTTKPIGVLCVALGVGSRSPGAADIIAHLEANPGMAWEGIKDLAPRVAGPERWEDQCDS